MALEDDEDYKAIKSEGHKRFIVNVLKGNNPTNAYRLAYPNHKYTVALTKASVLNKKYGHIIERNAPIDSVKLEKIANQTLHHLTLMAFADLGDMIDKNGEVKPVHLIPKPIRMAITEIEVDGNKIKYKMGGKIKALEVLSKVARLHSEQPEVNISLITEEERDSKIKEIVVRAMKRDEGEES